MLPTLTFYGKIKKDWQSFDEFFLEDCICRFGIFHDKNFKKLATLISLLSDAISCVCSLVTDFWFLSHKSKMDAPKTKIIMKKNKTGFVALCKGEEQKQTKKGWSAAVKIQSLFFFRVWKSWKTISFFPTPINFLLIFEKLIPF